MKYVNVSFLSTKDQEGLSSYTYKDTLGTKKYDAVLVPTRYGTSIAIVVKDDVKEPEYAVGGIKEVKEIISSKYVDDYTKSLKIKDLFGTTDVKVVASWLAYVRREKARKGNLARGRNPSVAGASTQHSVSGSKEDFAKLLAEYENLIK